MKLILGSDHAGYEAKEKIKEFLIKNQHEVNDVGCDKPERCDYPEYAIKVATSIVKGRNLSEQPLGILVCGSGIGVSMVANRFKGIRAALCRTTEDAELSRQHNNANILCLGARDNSITQLEQIIQSWLKSSFEAGRHEQRLRLFDKIGQSLEEDK